MPSLIVKLQNQTGQTHNYILSQDAVQPPKPLVIANVKVPQQGSAIITVDIPNPYYAYAITYQAPSHSSSVETIVKRAITLGKMQDDGTQTLGSSVQYVVTDKVPDLADGALPKEGKVNAFEIRTGSDFTEKDAKEGKQDRTSSSLMRDSLLERQFPHRLWKQGSGVPRVHTHACLIVSNFSQPSLLFEFRG